MNRHGDYSNNELGCYLPANVTLSGGFLTIESLVQSQVCGDSTHAASSWNYTSGMIQWNSLHFTYGTIEYRAKMPGGSGPWPAIWLLGYNCQASNIISADNIAPCNWPVPGSDEIDMTEILGGTTTVNQQIHTGSHNDGCGATTTDVSQNYHVYDLVWSPGSMVWKIDGKTTCTINQSYVPSTPMFLIINTAIGGAAGTPVNSTFPQSMSVDYVKVTQP
jgi:beta-glucanase (GH16 family)